MQPNNNNTNRSNQFNNFNDPPNNAPNGISGNQMFNNQVASAPYNNNNANYYPNKLQGMPYFLNNNMKDNDFNNFRPPANNEVDKRFNNNNNNNMNKSNSHVFYKQMPKRDPASFKVNIPSHQKAINNVHLTNTNQTNNLVRPNEFNNNGNFKTAYLMKQPQVPNLAFKQPLRNQQPGNQQFNNQFNQMHIKQQSDFIRTDKNIRIKNFNNEFNRQTSNSDFFNTNNQHLAATSSINNTQLKNSPVHINNSAFGQDPFSRNFPNNQSNFMPNMVNNQYNANFKVSPQNNFTNSNNWNKVDLINRDGVLNSSSNSNINNDTPLNVLSHNPFTNKQCPNNISNDPSNFSINANSINTHVNSITSNDRPYPYEQDSSRINISKLAFNIKLYSVLEPAVYTNLINCAEQYFQEYCNKLDVNSRLKNLPGLSETMLNIVLRTSGFLWHCAYEISKIRTDNTEFIGQDDFILQSYAVEKKLETFKQAQKQYKQPNQNNTDASYLGSSHNSDNNNLSEMNEQNYFKDNTNAIHISLCNNIFNAQINETIRERTRVKARQAQLTRKVKIEDLIAVLDLMNCEDKPILDTSLRTNKAFKTLYLTCYQPYSDFLLVPLIKQKQRETLLLRNIKDN